MAPSTNRQFTWGFKKLEELCQEEPHIITISLICNTNAFEDLLNSNMSNDTIVLILKILGKVSLITFVVARDVIINLAHNSKLLMRMKKFIASMQWTNTRPPNRNMYFWENVDGFFEDVATFFQCILDVAPTTELEVLFQTLQVFIGKIPHFGELLSSETKEKLLNLFKVVTLKVGPNRSYNNGETPNDFRRLSVYPTSEEVLYNKCAFVRSNVIDARYTSVHHYLDVHFRLLKEDFVAALRDGIDAYRQGSSDTSNVIIHKNVAFISPQVSRDQVGILVQFKQNNPKRKSRKNLYSKRFMQGSLLCFTKDNFRSMFFCRVVDGDEQLLENGQVVVGFESSFDHSILKHSYDMVECTVFFEPYYRVLKALQRKKEVGFPMKKYLVDVNPSLKIPAYVNSNTVYKVMGYNITLTSRNCWPLPRQLSLNDSQFLAFKAALTQEFVVIQGPPGTGKTFLGLKIAETLIRNESNWYTGTPILVVCLTNHALDQFLEGLIKVTDRVVRIGGQSKNEALKEYHLRQKQQNSTKMKPYVGTALYKCRKDIQTYLKSIQSWSNTLRAINKHECIISFRHFASIDREYSTSWFRSASDEQILTWLLRGISTQERRRQIEQMEQEEYYTSQEDESNSDTLMGDDLDELLDEYRNAFVFEYTDIVFHHNDDNCIYLRCTQYKFSSIESITKKISELKRTNRSASNELEQERQYMEACLNRGKRLRTVNKPRCSLRDPHTMAPQERWNLYFYWVEQYRQQLINNLISSQSEYRQKCKQLMEIRDMEDLYVMQQMLVVGMTTTGAARLQKTLMALKSRIVIVEEAAEVLESHITVSLTNSCEHLILIGDHQQLRPSTADYCMETKFNLGISLFERMIKNNIQCHTLRIQHRMRPEIAKLIVPAIYPQLENSPSVCQYPPVLGITSSLYFLDHNYKEITANRTSRSNLHEAKFLLALAQYLIRRGYKPEDITILAAYSGQMLELRKERSKFANSLVNVRITVLDNYQGEQSKIILLSLVRNNKEGNIGFLKTENRVCVALSRAREGFYIMGNMDMLCKRSEIWPKIKLALVLQKCLGTSLALCCENRHDHITQVKLAEDFKRVIVPCNKICNAKLNCGHLCIEICHKTNKDHKHTVCQVVVTYTCKDSHEYDKLCCEEKVKCFILMERTLTCMHQHTLPCYIDPRTFTCKVITTAMLPCSHRFADKPCHIPVNSFSCPYPCQQRLAECGHECTLKCHYVKDPNHTISKCQNKCDRLRKGCSTGEHYCRKECRQPCEICEVMVEKIVSECKHVISIECFQTPDRIFCGGQCTRRLNCGHACKETCRDPCSTWRCTEMIDNTHPVACGHQFKIECHLRNKALSSVSRELLQFCDAPCKGILECQHECSGTCGTCFQGRVHKPCEKQCNLTLICGHKCPSMCGLPCGPCVAMCSFRCGHKACSHKCGDPCICTEKCLRSCVHVQCPKICSDICTVSPCVRPCPKTLPCGHNCIGFCGDPCLPLCRLCDHADVMQISFQFDFLSKPRFVMLDECKQAVESERMIQWLKKSENEIKYKTCPKCIMPLTSTQRYSNFIKNVNDNINLSKKLCFSYEYHQTYLLPQLCKILSTYQNDNGRGFSESIILLRFFELLETQLAGIHDDIQSQAYYIKLRLIEDMLSIFKIADLKKKVREGRQHMEYLTELFAGRLTNQKISDLSRELNRYFRIVQMLQITESNSFTPIILINPPLQKLYDTIHDQLFSIEIHTDDIDKEIAIKLGKLAKSVGATVVNEKKRNLQNKKRITPVRWFKCLNGHVNISLALDSAWRKEKCQMCNVLLGSNNSHCCIM